MHLFNLSIFNSEESPFSKMSCIYFAYYLYDSESENWTYIVLGSSQEAEMTE